MRSLLVVALLAAVAHPAPLSVDWGRGLVTAEGIGLADRHAPSPAVARGTSRRDAEAAAREQLAAKVAALPVAGGGTVGDKAKADKAVAARIERAVANAVTVTADPETDGAWRVTLGVPTEAVRQALAGARPLAVGARDDGPQVVVIEVPAAAKPAIGWTVAGTSVPMLWVETLPAWAADASRSTAKSAKGGALVVDRMMGSPSVLYVIIPKK